MLSLPLLLLFLAAAIATTTTLAADVVYSGQTFTSAASITGTAQKTSPPATTGCQFLVTNCTFTVRAVIQATIIGDDCTIIVTNNTINDWANIEFSAVSNAQRISIIFANNTITRRNAVSNSDAFAISQSGAVAAPTEPIAGGTVVIHNNTIRFVNIANSANGNLGLKLMNLREAVCRFVGGVTITSNTFDISDETRGDGTQTPLWYAIQIILPESWPQLAGIPFTIVGNSYNNAQSNGKHILIGAIESSSCGGGCTSAMVFSNLLVTDNTMLFEGGPAGQPIDSAQIFRSSATAIAVTSSATTTIQRNRITVKKGLDSFAHIFRVFNFSARSSGSSSTSSSPSSALSFSNNALDLQSTKTSGVDVAIVRLGCSVASTNAACAPPNAPSCSILSDMNVIQNSLTVSDEAVGHFATLVLSSVAVRDTLLVQGNYMSLSNFDAADAAGSSAVAAVFAVGVARSSGSDPTGKPNFGGPNVVIGKLTLKNNNLRVSKKHNTVRPATEKAIRTATQLYVDEVFATTNEVLLVNNEIADSTTVDPVNGIVSSDSVSAVCFWCDRPTIPGSITPAVTTVPWTNGIRLESAKLRASHSSSGVSLLRVAKDRRLPLNKLTVFGSELWTPIGSYGTSPGGTNNINADDNTTELGFAVASAAGATQHVFVQPAGSTSVIFFENASTSCNKVTFTPAPAGGTTTPAAASAPDAFFFLKGSAFVSGIQDAQIQSSGGQQLFNSVCSHQATTATTTTTTVLGTTATTTSKAPTTTSTSAAPTPPTHTRELTRTETRYEMPFVPLGMSASEAATSQGVTSVAGVAAGVFAAPSAAMAVSRGTSVFMLAGCPSKDPKGKLWARSEINFPESLLPSVAFGHEHGGFARAAVVSFLVILAIAVVAGLVVGYVQFYGVSGCVTCACGFSSLEWWLNLAGVSPIPHFAGLVLAQIVGFWFRAMGVLVGATDRGSFLIDVILIVLLPFLVFVGVVVNFFGKFKEIMLTATGTATFGVVASAVAEDHEAKQQSRMKKLKREKEEQRAEKRKKEEERKNRLNKNNNDKSNNNTKKSVNADDIADGGDEQQQQESQAMLEAEALASQPPPKKWQLRLLRFLNSRYGKFLFIGDACWEATVVGSKGHVLLNRCRCIFGRLWGRPRLMERSELLLVGNDAPLLPGGLRSPTSPRSSPRLKPISPLMLPQKQHEQQQQQLKSVRFTLDEPTLLEQIQDWRIALCPFAYFMNLFATALVGFLTGIAQTQPESCPQILSFFAVVNTSIFVLFLWLRPSVVPMNNLLGNLMDLVTAIATIIAARNANQPDVSEHEMSAGARTVQTLIAVFLSMCAILLLLLVWTRLFMLKVLLGAVVMPLHVFEQQAFELDKMRVRNSHYQKQQQQIALSEQLVNNDGNNNNEQAAAVVKNDDPAVAAVRSGHTPLRVFEDALKDASCSSPSPTGAAAAAVVALSQEMVDVGKQQQQQQQQQPKKNSGNVEERQQEQEDDKRPEWERQFELIDRELRRSHSVGDERSTAHFRMNLDKMFDV